MMNIKRYYGMVLLLVLLIVSINSLFPSVSALFIGSDASTTIRNNYTSYINGSNINATSKVCSSLGANYFLQDYNNATGVYTCAESTGSGVSITTVQNYFANGTNLNKTYADTLYAAIGGGGDNTSWNQTYANTLYKSLGIETWNSTYSGFNKTYADTLYYSTSNPSGYITNTVNSSYYLISNPYGYYNSSTIPSFMLTSTAQNYFANGTNVNASSLSSNLSNYYLASNPSGYITDGNTNWNNIYGFTTINASSITCPAGDFVSAYNNATGIFTCTTPSGSGDNTSWSENRVRQLLNSTQIDAYTNQNFTIKESWLDTLYVRLTNIVSLVGNWTADKPSYSTTAQANALYKAIGIETWNSTSNGFNQTYADGRYKALGIQTWNDTQASFNKTYADVLYGNATNGTFASKTLVNNFTVNQTFNQNITVQQCIIFASGGKICNA